MYKSLHSLISTLTVDSCYFVGEDEYSRSSIITMLPEGTDIILTSYPDVDITNIPKADNSVDCLVADQVLEHVVDPQLAIDEVYRVLKPGGVTIITTCLMNPIHYASAIDEENNVPEDYWRFTPGGLRILLKKFTDIMECKGHGDFKFLYHCMSGYRDKIVEPGSNLEKIALGDDGKTYLHVWIVAVK